MSSQLTPLMLTASHGLEAAARLLLARGAVAGAQDSRSLTAVHWAAKNYAGPTTPARIAILDMLLAAGPPISAVSIYTQHSTALLHAVAFGDDCFLQHLVNKWPNTAAARKQQQEGWFYAAQRGQASMLPVFGGSFINSHNANGDTAFHVAADKGREAAVQVCP